MIAPMRRLLRPAAAVIAVVGLVLWFFGGPNMGRSEWFREGPGGRQFVFRPGLDFLAATLAAAGVLGLAGRGAPR